MLRGYTLGHYGLLGRAAGSTGIEGFFHNFDFDEEEISTAERTIVRFFYLRDERAEPKYMCQP